MGKGQISLDFLLATIVAIIFILGFQAVAASLESSQHKTIIRQQETAIGNSLAQLISTSAALNEENAEFEVQYKIPFIWIPGNDIPQECDIDIHLNKNNPTSETRNYINIKFYYGAETITKKIYLANTWGKKLNKNIECGNTIKIYLSNNGRLRIEEV